MKSVMLSIKPEYCALIANGKKTIEVRKTRPKIETPFKCYIYCTNDGRPLVYGDVFRGNWESEYVQTFGYSREEAERIWGVMNGKVMGEFVCDEIYELAPINHAPDDVEKKACLSREEIVGYIKGIGYGWHISDLKIYDEPQELSHFIKPGYEEMETLEDTLCNYCSQTEYGIHKSGTSPISGGWFCEGRWCESSYKEYLEKEFSLKRPPQSWCYVEERS